MVTKPKLLPQKSFPNKYLLYLWSLKPHWHIHLQARSGNRHAKIINISAMTNKHINIEYTEYDSIGQMSAEDQELAEKAIQASSKAYNPYSKFSVGAAVRLADGTIVTGANQENAAYPSGLCAERTAMFYASSQYPDVPMTALAIVGVNNGEICGTPATPCGACRQVMAEYQNKGGRPIEVILIGSQKIWKFSRIDDILPFIFDSLDKGD